MPTYDYKCLECGHLFERFQAMTATPVQECEACQGPVKRLIGSGAGLIFKGSGYYCTDFKNNGTAAAAKPTAAEPAAATPPAAAPAKSEPAPAKAAAPAPPAQS